MDIKILVDEHLPLLVSLVVMLLAGIGCYSVIISALLLCAVSSMQLAISCF